jgi:hypothetical protein
MNTQTKQQWEKIMRQEQQYWAAQGRPQRSQAALSLQALLAGLNMFKPRKAEA